MSETQIRINISIIFLIRRITHWISTFLDSLSRELILGMVYYGVIFCSFSEVKLTTNLAIYSKRVIWLYYLCMHCERNLIQTAYSSPHVFIILICWENLNSSFRGFQVYNSVLSMAITMLYIRFSDLYSTYNWEFVPLQLCIPHATIPWQPSIILLFVSMNLPLPSSLPPSLSPLLSFFFFSVFLSASFFLLNYPFKW